MYHTFLHMFICTMYTLYPRHNITVEIPFIRSIKLSWWQSLFTGNCPTPYSKQLQQNYTYM